MVKITTAEGPPPDNGLIAGDTIEVDQAALMKGKIVVTAIKPASQFQPGDVVKIKRSDKTKSPYSTIAAVHDDTKQLDLMPFDAPGSGNRKQRRARFAEGRGK